MATMSSAQIVSPTAFQNKMALQGLSRPAYPATGGVSLICVPHIFTSHWNGAILDFITESVFIVHNLDAIVSSNRG